MMGARGQVCINGYFDDTNVYLYTHWGAPNLVGDVREALAKKWRWDDPEYLARIIFEVMIEGQEGTETGFGIGTHMHGDIDVLITINCSEKRVRVSSYGKEDYEQTFEEFVGEGTPKSMTMSDESW